MDIRAYKEMSDEELAETIQRLPRSTMDEEFQNLAGQYARLCQRLEAVFADGREEQFAAIRPGGLEEIDAAIVRAQQERPLDVPLLQDFRALNRILLPFMDAYENQVLNDLKHMSKDDLENVYASVSAQLSAAIMQAAKATDYRAEQNASGKIRLGTMLKKAAQKELTDRFGVIPES